MTAPLTQTTGRRKRAVARASLRPGTGQFDINGKTLEAYFPTDASQMIVTEPLNLTDTRNSYDVTASIHGGGESGYSGGGYGGFTDASTGLMAPRGCPGGGSGGAFVRVASSSIHG